MRTDPAVRAPERRWPFPFPPSPEPDPQRRDVQVHTPVVFVPPTYEYKHLTRGVAVTLSEAELNELGAAGWELSGVVVVGADAHFYFKRATS
jgi:hypothetical protein